VDALGQRRFGEGRQPVKRADPGRGIVAVLNAVSTSHARAVAFLILCGLLFYLPGFFTIPAVDRDEARFAQATRQMVETGKKYSAGATTMVKSTIRRTRLILMRLRAGPASSNLDIFSLHSANWHRSTNRYGFG